MSSAQPSVTHTAAGASTTASAFTETTKGGAAPSRSSASPPPVTLPTVNIPVLAPGYPLAVDTAALEASTSRYFQAGQNPYGKRGRLAADVAASATVLDTLTVEESGHGCEATASSAAKASRPDTVAVESAARTRRYLTTLFQDPTRCEQDVYRLVDVALCRRTLREAEEAVRKDSDATAKTASAFDSCLTLGQHRRYRALVVEWLRHQPSRAAPPDSGEVLKVVQQEQRLFLEVLRREAVAPLSAAAASLYEYLSPALVSFAQVHRTGRMRRHLLSFLADAKRHESRVVLCCCPPSTAADGADGSRSAEEDYGGVTFEHDGDAAAEAKAERVLTPQQLFQRRYPSLRVLQWHMAKLYNSQQTGTAAPFPNPHVQSTAVDDERAGVHASQATSPTQRASSSSSSSVAPRRCPAVLRVDRLPQQQPSEGERDHGSDSGEEVGDGGREGDETDGPGDGGEGETVSPYAATHALAAATSSPLTVATVRAYVEQHLLPRFGWRPSKYGGGGGEAVKQPVGLDQSRSEIVSMSLAVTFPALLKLFVAHVDTEEPRTSFRVPLRICVTPLQATAESGGREGGGGGGGGGGGITAAAPPSGRVTRYHAHVVMGDAVPNVAESRHGVHLAAAEYLLRQVSCSAITDPPSESAAEARRFTSPTAASSFSLSSPGTCSALANVVLTRSATMQGTVEQGEAAVQAAGGDRIKASAAVLLSMKDAVADAAPPLPFQVYAETASSSSSVTAASMASGETPPSLLFDLVKMEHLNRTSAGSPPHVRGAVAQLGAAEVAERCPFLLEALSPRELLQLDLIFGCYPRAVVHVHRVQYVPAATGHEETGEEEAPVERMEVLAVETLTSARWAALRQQLQHRPVESLITSPTPAEVLATHSWDLLYDTLAWMLDSVERRVCDALNAPVDAAADSSEPAEESGDARYVYLILSNHANLVNTSASTKLHAKAPRRADRAAEDVAATFTESRFAVRYVLQDASELYPDYEPRIDINLEAANLRFLEEEGRNSSNPKASSGGDDDAGNGLSAAEAEEGGVSAVASRLYRDPHTWNADTIPFTFPRHARDGAKLSSLPTASTPGK